MSHIILAGFDKHDNADSAYRELLNHDFDPKDFSVIAAQTDEHTSKDTAADAAEGTAAGAVSGAATGAAIGTLAGMLSAAVLIPPISGVVIGGPIVAALGLTGAAATVAGGAITGTAAGGATGGIIGLFTGIGVSETGAQEFKEIIDDGGYVIGIPVNDSNEEEVESICKANHVTKSKEVSIG